MFFLASPADEVAPAHRQAIVTVLVGRPMSRCGGSCASPTGRPMPTGTVST
uniref:Uncharacterized protein n=1 Tax=Phenylobacterium glaciei TaxID=2803784 RepID=A0A974P673_9CAUL|nr:hypothetical protein JKL49_13540 [Phenylobacterium glaciei]